MRDLSEGLVAHLDGTVTTLCTCWLVTRQDGVKLGFTDHDRAVIVDGVACEPESGLTGSGAEYSSGLNADSWSADGILSSDAITEDDLRVGLYDRAIIEQWLVNWKAPNEAQRLTRALMGEISIADNRYTIELRSITTLLDRDHTRFFATECDAELGDTRCGIDRENYGVQATIIEQRDNNRVRLQPSSVVDATRYHAGTIALIDGRTARLNEVSPLDNGQLIDAVLDRSLGVLEEGLSVMLYQGCDKQFLTCRSRFQNGANFRGFPHIPGGENTLNYADEEGEYNGEPLVR